MTSAVDSLTVRLVPSLFSMRSLIPFISLITLHGASCLAAESSSASTSSDYEFKMSPEAEDLLVNYCFDCHGDGVSKGDISLDDLEDLPHPARLDLFNKLLEQVYNKEMPPKDEFQPTDSERDALAQWLWGELKPFNASKLDDKLRYYKYANYLDHEKLFSGEIKAAPYTKSRRWRVNELIYHERVNEVFELTGNQRQETFFGVVKPFNLPTHSGVKYYDTEIVEGGQFLTLMSNAKWIVDRQLRSALLENGEFEYNEEYLNAKAKGARHFGIKFPGEVWNLGTTAEPFERIISSKNEPSDAWLQAAISHQFKVAIHREPTQAEMEKYLQFTKHTLNVSDKTSALKKMMMSVLMEPEFLYRNEFGGGPKDAHGRIKLTPREASFAIGYALTDRVPDEELVAAANSGKLSTPEDYEREVRRILADSSIDKPRILRFFQDYFGYLGIYDVFKDEERFAGAYNPHRVVSTSYIYRVPGKVSGEADQLVKWVLEKDQDVLATLLTTDRFFVHHNGNNKEMAKEAEKAAEDHALYRILLRELGDLKGKELVEGVRKLDKKMPEHQLVKTYLKPDGKSPKRALRYHMDWARLFFGEDGKKSPDPDKTFMPHDRESIAHSVKMYNLDYLNWSYETEQPMKLENRVGILTHPAWLVANSHNAVTDPMHRGIWIQEKLLGGFIRDVPITVDAKVPEDPHRTLRERFSVTEEQKCWHCHVKMNPLGFVFESYDDFGRYRTEEELEHPENIIKTKTMRAKSFNSILQTYKIPVYETKSINTEGFLEGTGDPSLDGKVTDVKDLMTRLAKSEKVRQVFVRNVFRYFMGRNETFADSQTLINADNAYVNSGGSFNELMVSLLTSESFIYRK